MWQIFRQLHNCSYGNKEIRTFSTQSSLRISHASGGSVFSILCLHTVVSKVSLEPAGQGTSSPSFDLCARASTLDSEAGEDGPKSRVLCVLRSCSKNSLIYSGQVMKN